MTTTYDPYIIDRLVKEARDSFRSSMRSGGSCSMSRHSLAAMADQLEAAQREVDHWREARRTAIEAGDVLKGQLEAARREVERLRGESFQEAVTTLALSNSNRAKDERLDLMAPVVEAAERWRDQDVFDGLGFEVSHALVHAIDAYRAAKGRT